MGDPGASGDAVEYGRYAWVDYFSVSVDVGDGDGYVATPESVVGVSW